MKLVHLALSMFLLSGCAGGRDQLFSRAMSESTARAYLSVQNTRYKEDVLIFYSRTSQRLFSSVDFGAGFRRISAEQVIRDNAGLSIIIKCWKDRSCNSDLFLNCSFSRKISNGVNSDIVLEKFFELRKLGFPIFSLTVERDSANGEQKVISIYFTECDKQSDDITRVLTQLE